MQMASSWQDTIRRNGVFDGLFDDISLPSFMDPGSWGSAPAAPVGTIPAPADTSNFWTQTLPSLLTSGLTTYAQVEAMNNPAAALARSYSAPPGVTSVNPYGIPSGMALPPGVTPAGYAYPMQTVQAGMLGGLSLPLLIGGGLLLGAYLLMKR